MRSKFVSSIVVVLVLSLLVAICWPHFVKEWRAHLDQEARERQTRVDYEIQRTKYMQVSIEFQNAKIALDINLLSDLLKTSQGDWGYADKVAWSDGIRALKNDLLGYSSLGNFYNAEGMDLELPKIDQSTWPIQVRASLLSPYDNSAVAK